MFGVKQYHSLLATGVLIYRVRELALQSFLVLQMSDFNFADYHLKG